MPTGRFSHTNPHDSFDNYKAYAKQKLINLGCCKGKEAKEKKRAEENAVSCAAPDEKNRRMKTTALAEKLTGD